MSVLARHLLKISDTCMQSIKQETEHFLNFIKIRVHVLQLSLLLEDWSLRIIQLGKHCPVDPTNQKLTFSVAQLKSRGVSLFQYIVLFLPPSKGFVIWIMGMILILFECYTVWNIVQQVFPQGFADSKVSIVQSDTSMKQFSESS